MSESLSDYNNRETELLRKEFSEVTKNHGLTNKIHIGMDNLHKEISHLY